MKCLRCILAATPTYRRLCVACIANSYFHKQIDFSCFIVAGCLSGICVLLLLLLLLIKHIQLRATAEQCNYTHINTNTCTVGCVISLQLQYKYKKYCIFAFFYFFSALCAPLTQIRHICLQADVLKICFDFVCSKHF